MFRIWWWRNNEKPLIPQKTDYIYLKSTCLLNSKWTAMEQIPLLEIGVIARIVAQHLFNSYYRRGCEDLRNVMVVFGDCDFTKICIEHYYTRVLFRRYKVDDIVGVLQKLLNKKNRVSITWYDVYKRFMDEMRYRKRIEFEKLDKGEHRLILYYLAPYYGFVVHQTDITTWDQRYHSGSKRGYRLSNYEDFWDNLPKEFENGVPLSTLKGFKIDNLKHYTQVNEGSGDEPLYLIRETDDDGNEYYFDKTGMAHHTKTLVCERIVSLPHRLRE